MEKYGLDRFYPTSCLVTGHDIIFFWVARMMMFSLKILNKIPFDDVYIHAIVRDKMGRKMSKSLGNGIDPLEMIALYGADALRFTLASGSGHNRDLNLDPDRIAINRNLMNKIWNAYRFSAPFITNVSANLPEIKNLDLHERWIVSELNTMIHLVSKSLDQYRFDEACTHIYSFIYDKFCSWFIELSKPVLYKGDEVSKQKRGQVLRWSFRQIVMVLHPLAPFITEELWQSLKDTNEDLLIQTKYPIYSKLHDFSAEQIKMNLFTNCISLIRNLRASVEIKPKDLIEVHIKALKIDSCNHLKELESEICNMAGLNKIKWLESSALSPSKGVFATDGQIEICIGLSNIPNLDQQVERMKKNITKIEKEFEKLNNKLSNPKFVENAPEEVIQEVTYEKNLLHDQLNSLKSNLSKFQ
jgi:valyl-tRNA synthetase